MSGNVQRERIIVPKPLVPALLYHLHNHNDAHPARTQQKASFQRQFFAITLDKHLDLLYKNCYKCAVIQKLPKQNVPNETKTLVEGPQTHFHADVIKRAGQNILTVKDHFSSYQDAIIIDSEKAQDLKQGLIILTAAMRRPGQIFVSVDNSPGFKSLSGQPDKDLAKLNIEIIKTDEINKNANAVIDKGCQELEDELKRLEPEGGKISLATLKLAILNLNSKLRRRGNISSYEINTARDQDSGANLQLDDKSLRQDQLAKRNDTRNLPESPGMVNVGDTVKIKNKTDKHKANEIFVVTAEAKEDKVGIQKILHPLQGSKAKIMSKVYQANPKHLVMVHKAEQVNYDEEDETYDDPHEPSPVKTETPWNPINSNFYHDSSDDEEDDEEINLKPSDHARVPAVPLQLSDADNELEWDNSPEQFQLQPSPEHSADEALLPRQLFNQEDSNEEETHVDLTDSTSDEEVFHRDEFATPPSAPRLKRNNAMRIKRNIEPVSEPRTTVTREFLHSGRYQSISNPTTPSQVVLNERQSLGNILNPRNPIVPETVAMNQEVQRLEQALDEHQNRRMRARKKIDYAKLHKFGR